MNKELEEKYSKIIKDAEAEIFKHVAEASAALEKAVKISQETGVPFRSPISFISNCYKPTTFIDKFKVDDDEDALEDLLESLDIYGNDYGCGWSHSAVC